MKIRRFVLLLAAAVLAISSFLADPVPAKASETTNQWYEPSTGTYCYEVGDEDCNWDTDMWLTLSDKLPNGMSWSEVMYISAEVTVTGKALPVLEVSGTDIKGNDDVIENGSASLFLASNGADMTGLGLNFFAYDEETWSIRAAAGSIITVTNVTFHENYDGLLNQWYSPTEGTYCYVDAEDGTAMFGTEKPFLNNLSLTAPCYISADIAVEGRASDIRLMANGPDGAFQPGPVYPCVDNTENPVFTARMYLSGEDDYNLINIDSWDFDDGAKITISNVTIKDGYIPENEYTAITGEWVQTGPTSYYYRSASDGEVSATSYLPEPECGWSAVQTMTLNGYRSANALGNPTFIGFNTLLNEDVHLDFNLIEKDFARPIVKKVRGQWNEEVQLVSWYASEGAEFYITDISYGTEPVPEIEIGPNDIFVDEDSTLFYEVDGDLWISGDKLRAAITTPGTLRIYMQPNEYGDKHEFCCWWDDWGENSEYKYVWIDEFTVTEDQPYYEIPVTEDIVKQISTRTDEWGQCTFGFPLSGIGVNYEKTVFVPTPDAPAPEHNQENEGNLSNEKKEELNNSKGNIVDENDAPLSGDRFHGNAFGQKKHKSNGKHTYRVVQRFDKQELNLAKWFKITLYSKKHNKYINYTLDACFDSLNINGYKVNAGDDYVFAALIIDEIEADDEITFTNFEIEYNN